jgi:hypothetical protein
MMLVSLDLEDESDDYNYTINQRRNTKEQKDSRVSIRISKSI